MEDLGFFPYPSSFSTGFHDEILDPGPTSFFLKDPHGEDVLLGQGLDQLQAKLGLSIFEEDKGSPVNVDDNDWLMRDLSDEVSIKDEPIDIPFTLDDIKNEGFVLCDGILQDPNQIIEPLDANSFCEDPLKMDPGINSTFNQKDGYKCLVCNIALFRLKDVIGHILTLHCSKGDYNCTLCNTELLTVGSVKKHIKNVHFGFKPFQCPVCKKQIQQKSHLKTHIDKQHGGKKGILKKALLNHSKQMKKKVSNSDLTCPLCHKVYLSVETKERHLITFHKQKPPENLAPISNPRRKSTDSHGPNLECPVCLITLDNLEDKKSHVKNIHHNLRTLECKKCKNIFYSQLHLKAHEMAKHGIPGNFHQCEYHNCKAPMKNLSDLLHHVEEMHAYQCPECPRHLQTTSGLAKHYKKAHISNELLCCTYCGNCYKDEEELNNHIFEKHESSSESENDPKMNLVEKIMHQDVLNSIKKSVAKLAQKGNRNGGIPCEYCRANEKFATEQEVIEHIKNMHPIQCPDCPLKMFKYPTSVRKHFKKFHGSHTPYFCKTCTLVFKSPAEVQNHMENEHGIANIVVVNNINLINCVVCGMTFENGQALAEHRAENHFYKCLECDKEYKLTDSLRKHVKVTHNENVTMTCCKFCDKVFMDTSQKSGHMATMHPNLCSNVQKNQIQDPLGDKFECPKCYKIFGNSETLAKHAKFFHNLKLNEDKKLNENSLLKMNNGAENVKQEEAVYKCPKCPKTYEISKSLRKHCRKNHNQLSICFCQHCPKVFVNASQRDAHLDKEHSHLKISNSRESPLKSTPIKTTISVNLHSNSSPVSTQNTSPNSPRIIVVKSPTNKSGNSGMTTILKKVEVIQPSKCPHCHEFISNLKTHVCELPWKCPVCGKRYKLNSGLRKHCREGHGLGQVAVCESCQITFMDGITGLEEHNREKHSVPSSPESFHGFVTPTKELEMSKRFETIILNLSDI